MVWCYPYSLDGWWNTLPDGWVAVTYSSVTTGWIFKLNYSELE